jgi:Flp pilus assembly protein TadG
VTHVQDTKAIRRQAVKARKQAGQALIFAVLALGILLMGFAGLGIDMGVMRYEKRLLQTAADAAAIAAANNLNYGGVTAAAQNAAKENGFTAATTNIGEACPSTVSNVTLTVNNGPLSGPHSGNSSYVEVCVAMSQPTFFMRLLRVNNETISARAVATNVSGGPGSGCLYLLGNTGTDLALNGNDQIQAPTCGIVDDSSMTINGNNTVKAGSIGVAGSYTSNGNSSVSPAPVTGIPPAADPLAYLPTPSGGACVPNPNLNGNGTAVLNQGNYCSGITINGNINVTFTSGTYILGNNFTSNGNGTLSGSGVTFYIQSGTVTLNGNNTLTFSAPTTGAYAGILFWQAASDSNVATLNGNNASKLEGILYFPGAQLNMNGNNALATYTVIVASSLRMNGNNTVTLSADTSGLTDGSPIKNTVLVE